MTTKNSSLYEHIYIYLSTVMMHITKSAGVRTRALFTSAVYIHNIYIYHKCELQLGSVFKITPNIKYAAYKHLSWEMAEITFAFIIYIQVLFSIAWGDIVSHISNNIFIPQPHQFIECLIVVGAFRVFVEEYFPLCYIFCALEKKMFLVFELSQNTVFTLSFFSGNILVPASFYF